MAYREMPDLIVPPSDRRCEAMTKPTNGYQTWRNQSHRCVRKATQGREGHIVCSLHSCMKKVKWWNGEPDNFPHKRFWKWPTKWAILAQAVISKTK